jgi:hypothetical protein
MQVAMDGKGKRKIKKTLSTDDGKRLESIQWVHYWTIYYWNISYQV